MYDSGLQYPISGFITEIPKDFLQNFEGSYSHENPNENHICREFLNQKSETVLFILHMIYEGIVVGNEYYSRLIPITVPFLDKIISKNKSINQILNKINPNYPLCLIENSILYLLPYAAQMFQTLDSFNTFDLLLSSYSTIMRFNDQKISLFNSYISSLLENQTKTYHHIIISLYFASHMYFDLLTKENNQLICNIIKYFLQILPNCDINDNKTITQNLSCYITFNDKMTLSPCQQFIIIVETIFQKLQRLITKYILMNYIPYQQFIYIITSFIEIFIAKSHQCIENKINADFSSEIKLINCILNFIKFFIKISDNKIPDKRMFCPIINFFYQKSISIAVFSNHTCSFSLIKLIYNNFEYIQISEQDLPFLYQFLVFFSYIQMNDLIQLQSSQEGFYFDNLDIDLTNNNTAKCSQRHAVAFIIHKIFFSDKFVPIFSYLIYQLSNEKEIKDNHLFLLSLLNSISTSFTEQSQVILPQLHQLTLKYLTISSKNAADFLKHPECFMNAQVSCYIFSYYDLLCKSIDILDDNEVNTIKQEISPLYIICNIKDHPYLPILFTNLCNFSCKLLDRNQLNEKMLEQLFIFIGTNLPLCFTNDANDFIFSLSAKYGRPQFIENVFDNYLNQCKQSFLDLIPSLDGYQYIPGRIMISEGAKETKLYIHGKKQFLECLDKIYNIFSILDAFTFDSQKLLVLVHFLICYGDDWEFKEEAPSLISLILQKTPNFQDWTKCYIDYISEAKRNLGFGEWVVPLIHLVSYRLNEIDAEFLYNLINLMKQYFDILISNNNYMLFSTEDSANFYNLLTIMFEIAFFKNIPINQDILLFFYNLTTKRPTTEKESSDFLPNVHSISEILLKLTAILAGLQIPQNEFIDLFKKIVEHNLIINDELRYLTIILIDFYIKGNNNNSLAQLRQACLTNTNPKNQEFLHDYEEYTTCSEINVDVEHPMMSFYKIDGFVFTTPNSD